MNFTTSTTRSQNLRNRKNKRRGAGLVEYIGIVALVGIATVPILSLFGSSITQIVAQHINVLKGDPAKDIVVNVTEDHTTGVTMNQDPSRNGTADFRPK